MRHCRMSTRLRAAALAKTKLALSAVPPRYRSSYFLHIWSNGYSAGYYAYLWSEMLEDDGFQWFLDHGGLTRENGERFRRMVLSKGNSEELGTMYKAWLGREPSIEPMKRDRGGASTVRKRQAGQSHERLWLSKLAPFGR